MMHTRRSAAFGAAFEAFTGFKGMFFTSAALEASDESLSIFWIESIIGGSHMPIYHESTIKNREYHRILAIWFNACCVPPTR